MSIETCTSSALTFTAYRALPLRRLELRTTHDRFHAVLGVRWTTLDLEGGLSAGMVIVHVRVTQFGDGGTDLAELLAAFKLFRIIFEQGLGVGLAWCYYGSPSRLELFDFDFRQFSYFRTVSLCLSMMFMAQRLPVVHVEF